jgi:hypothetical protein
MKMSGNNFQQVPLTIYQDWNQTLAAANKLLALKNHQSPESFGQADHYSLKLLGNISEHIPSKSWFRISSHIINKTMPWLDQMLNMMRELKPDDGAISLLKGDGASHIDLPFIPSALNYIFYSTDPAAHTWICDNDLIEKHPSTVNSAWIIDTQKQHGIANNGTRYTLNIHFGVEYVTLRKWFNRQTQASLTFGSVCGTIA